MWTWAEAVCNPFVSESLSYKVEYCARSTGKYKQLHMLRGIDCLHLQGHAVQEKWRILAFLIQRLFNPWVHHRVAFPYRYTVWDSRLSWHCWWQFKSQPAGHWTCRQCLPSEIHCYVHHVVLHNFPQDLNFPHLSSTTPITSNFVYHVCWFVCGDVIVSELYRCST